MNELALRYGAVLYELSVPEEEIRQAGQILRDTPELDRVLASPAVALKHKARVIERVFGSEGAGLSAYMTRFLIKLCEADGIGGYPEVVRAWQSARMQAEGCIEATLCCVTPPDEKQREGIEAFLKNRFHAKEVKLTQVQSPELLGGFLLKAGDTEFDYSLRGRMKKLRRAVTG